ncbi:hypothetical protein BS049_RS23270 [Vibrio parahaemolyticus]|nr:hypothetical protein [Vibrio parahaemolyticus]
MFYLCATLGLRNSECRELKNGHIDWATQTLHLRDSKGTRAFITRRANQHFEAHWLAVGRRWLRENIRDKHISLIVRMAHFSQWLNELAEEYGVLDAFSEFYKQYRDDVLPRFRLEAQKQAPKGRRIDLSLYPKALSILRCRHQHALERDGEYLFARCELGRGKAIGDK